MRTLYYRSLCLLLVLSCSQNPSPAKPKGSTDGSSASAPAEDEPLKAQVLLRLLYRALNEGHYHPQPVDDKFSERFFTLYLEQIDYNKRILTIDDYNKLAQYKDKIDDQLKDGYYEFFRVSFDIQKKQEAKIKGWCDTHLAKPFDFTVDESLVDDPKKVEYAKNDAELSDRWRKTVKLWTLSRLVDQLEIQEKAKEKGDTKIEQKSFETLEAEARQKTQKFCSDLYDRLAKYDLEERRGAYLNTMAVLYDPHTTYFPPKDKANFEIEASGALEGIGARLQEKDGYITVSEVVPGSPAALQGELAANDAILEVAQENQDPVNVVGMEIDDAIKMIRGPKGTKVTLTIKKLDGNVKKITITRDVVLIEESYAKATVLQKDGHKVGLIDLPSFYADFGGAGGNSSANDVLKKLKELDSEGVDQLILDLRSNGGGSLSDAVRIVGFFIEKGPVVQVKDSEGAIEVLSDKDSTIPFKGDLVVLVDGQSASASEIVAAAIQDYKRGVLIGSTSTFGKGTVQQLIDLDRFVPEDTDDIKPLGALKLTLQKFYRVNGGSTQLKGVTSDIVLNDEFIYLKMGEKDYNNPAPWDEIKPTLYKEWKPKYSMQKLQEESLARTKVNPIFQAIEEDAKRLKKNSEQTNIPLKLDAYRAERKRLEEEAKKFDDLWVPIKGLEMKTLSAEQKSMQDPAKKDRIDAWYKQLSKDPYVGEALNVLSQMR